MQCLLDFQPSFCGVKGKERTNGIHHSSEMVAEFNAANPTCSTLYFSLYPLNYMKLSTPLPIEIFSPSKYKYRIVFFLNFDVTSHEGLVPKPYTCHLNRISIVFSTGILHLFKNLWEYKHQLTIIHLWIWLGSTMLVVMIHFNCHLIWCLFSISHEIFYRANRSQGDFFFQLGHEVWTRFTGEIYCNFHIIQT